MRMRAKDAGRSRIPGVPRVGDNETSDNLDTVQTRAYQTSQAFVRGHRLGVIPSKRALSERIEFGGRGTHVEGEVVVHGVVVGSSGSRNGS